MAVGDTSSQLKTSQDTISWLLFFCKDSIQTKKHKTPASTNRFQLTRPYAHNTTYTNKNMYMDMCIYVH